MKVAIWANSPSPHQCDFYAALRKSRIDVRVTYLGRLGAARRALGWDEAEVQPAGEVVLRDNQTPFAQIPDWQQRIHIVPGYSRRFYWKLALTLSRAGVPWAHWSENSQPSWRSPLTFALKRWYGNLVSRHALGAFAIGRHAERDFVRWGIRQEMIAHLYYAIRGSGPLESRTLDPTTAEFVAGRTAFVYAGSVCHNKASMELVRAFAAVAATRPDVALVVVGGGPKLDACRRTVDKLGLQKSVLFRGVVPITNIGSIMACCQVLVLPSRYDGWGVVLNEAASAGLALVASNRVGAANHLVEPGHNGFLVRAGSMPSLATALQAYANDRQLAALHGGNSRALFERFTPEMNVQRFATSIRGWLAVRPQWAEFHARSLAVNSVATSLPAAA